MLTKAQKRTIKSILRLIETGSIKPQYSKLVILDDGAGITYGEMQTTENGGGLHILLAIYINKKGIFAQELLPYMEKLYDGQPANRSRKFALTQNEAFKALLVRMGNEDPLMAEAQSDFFDRYYFTPALNLCMKYEITTPLGIAVVFDSCIQSGVSATEATHLPDFTEQYDGVPSSPDDPAFAEWDKNKDGELDAVEREQGFISKYILYRFAFLTQHRRLAVRNSAYRMQLFQNLVDADNWFLTLPTKVGWVNAEIETSSGETRHVTKEVTLSLEEMEA